jgi:outer membrane protein assembly factor BamB
MRWMLRQGSSGGDSRRERMRISITRSEFSRRPRLADGMVYFGCRDSHLNALDARTGEKKLAFSGNGSWVISSPAVKDGKVFFDTSDTSLVVEADAKTGAVLHSTTLNHWYLYWSPAIAGGRMYVGSTQGELVAIDLAGFNPAWSFETEGMKQHGRPIQTRMELLTRRRSIHQTSTMTWWPGWIG